MGSTEGKIKFTISKTFRFEAAHRLLRNYCGKCNNNHGHSWEVKVYLSGYQLDDRDMLYDFKDLNKLKVWINDSFDHVTILWKEDPMIKFLNESNQKVFVTEKNPTSEHLATNIFKKASEMFNTEDIWIDSVEINETCTSSARIFKED
jgi:6-pyruvoyltetrahydropterin/6-carboxytetrahydropterin synthase